MRSMKDEQQLIAETCQLLTIAQLKSLCEKRGFSPPFMDKERLLAFVVGRFAETTGVQAALARLEPKWILALHRIRLSPGALALESLHRIVGSRDTWRCDVRELFREAADALLASGVAVAVDSLPSTGSGSRSRYSYISLSLLSSHRPLLPPLPVDSCEPGPIVETHDLAGFCKEALLRAIEHPAAIRPRHSSPLMDRVSALISLQKGALLFSGGEVKSAEHLVEKVLAEWLRPTSTAEGWSTQLRRESVPGEDEEEARYRRFGMTPPPPKSWNLYPFAAYVLEQLAEGQALSCGGLVEAMGKLGIDCSTGDLDGFLYDGVSAGFLACHGKKNNRLYRLASTPQSPDWNLTLTPTKEGAFVDIQQSGLQGLVRLAQVARCEMVQGTKFHATPAPILMGRIEAVEHWPLFDSLKACPAWADALKSLVAHRGRVILHRRLIVLEVADLGLRTLLKHNLGCMAKEISGNFIAIAESSLDKAVKIAKKEGYSPRIIKA